MKGKLGCYHADFRFPATGKQSIDQFSIRQISKAVQHTLSL